MAAEKYDVNIYGATLDTKEEEQKYKYKDC